MLSIFLMKLNAIRRISTGFGLYVPSMRVRCSAGRCS